MIGLVAGWFRISKWMFLSALLTSSPALAGAPPDSTGSALSLDKGRLFTMAGQEVQFSKLTLSRTTCEYWPSGQGESRTIPATEVVRIERETRNNAVKWGLVGGLTGLGSMAVTVLMADSPKGIVGPGTKAAFVLGGGTLGALIGAVAGIRSRRFVTVYQNPLVPR